MNQTQKGEHKQQKQRPISHAHYLFAEYPERRNTERTQTQRSEKDFSETEQNPTNKNENQIQSTINYRRTR